jgi:hypothetical protein
MKPLNNFNHYLAAALLSNTRRHFSRLHGDYLQEIQMATTDSQNMDATLPLTKSVGTPAEGRKLAARPNGDLDDRRTIEGSTPGDHRFKPAVGDITASFKTQAPPRAPVKGQAPAGKNLQSNIPVPEGAYTTEGTEG